MKSIASDNGVTAVPSLVLFVKGKAYPYEGYNSVEPVVEYIKKQLASPAASLKTTAEVDAFIELRSSRKYSLSSVHVVRPSLGEWKGNPIPNQLFGAIRLGFSQSTKI
jgi:hypothetical protein